MRNTLAIALMTLMLGAGLQPASLAQSGSTTITIEFGAAFVGRMRTAGTRTRIQTRAAPGEPVAVSGRPRTVVNWPSVGGDRSKWHSVEGTDIYQQDTAGTVCVITRATATCF